MEEGGQTFDKRQEEGQERNVPWLLHGETTSSQFVYHTTSNKERKGEGRHKKRERQGRKQDRSVYLGYRTEKTLLFPPLLLNLFVSPIGKCHHLATPDLTSSSFSWLFLPSLLLEANRSPPHFSGTSFISSIGFAHVNKDKHYVLTRVASQPPLY